MQRTSGRADVGVYTGGWHGGTTGGGDAAEPHLDAGAAGDVFEPCAAGVGCGRVWQTRTYCGGPAPSDELVRQLATPVPLTGWFVVRPGTVHDPSLPITARFASGDDGRFAFDAEPGVYCLVTLDKVDFLGPQGDPGAGEAIPVPSFGAGVAECMDQWARTCDAVVTIGTTPTPPAELTLQQGCAANPCLPPPAYP